MILKRNQRNTHRDITVLFNTQKIKTADFTDKNLLLEKCPELISVATTTALSVPNLSFSEFRRILLRQL